MSPTAARAAPERTPIQPGLLGIPEAPLVADLRYSVVGQLHRMAEVRITADGQHAHLIVRIVQRTRGGRDMPPLVCVQQAHHTDVIALEALAQRLHTGAYVLALCRGIEFDAAHHELRAGRCDRIEPLTPEQAEPFLPDQPLTELCAEPHPPGPHV